MKLKFLALGFKVKAIVSINQVLKPEGFNQEINKVKLKLLSGKFLKSARLLTDELYSYML